jgi:ElaB/YqjD/DUF883 family membrane-anchored ribosome-binding protein
MGKDPDAIEREIEERRERIGERIDALSYKADVKSRVGDSIAEKRDQVTGRVSEFFSGASERVSGATGGLSERVSGATDTLSDRTPSGEDVKQKTQRAAGLVRENPLGLAIGAAAAGFLIGLVLPSTRMEDERLGEVADTVKAKATEAGQEALSRGQQVAQDAAQAAKQTAQESGSQHASEMADTAKQKASEAADEAKSSTQG